MGEEQLIISTVGFYCPIINSPVVFKLSGMFLSVFVCLFLFFEIKEVEK